MEAQIPTKSTRTRKAKRKEHQRVNNYLESTDCSSEDEKVYFRPRFTRSQHQPLQKERDSQSSADISSDNSVAKSNCPKYNRDHHQQHREENFQSSTDILSDNAIAQSNSQRYIGDHDQQCQSMNSPEKERKTFHRVESEKPAACTQSTVGRTAVQRNQRILKKVEVSDLEETADGDMRVKQRKGGQATGERKNDNMRQRSRGDIDFEAVKNEEHVFAMKHGDQGYIQADEHTVKPDLTLGNMDCIPRFRNNIFSLLGTTIRNNDDNQNIVGSVNYFVPQSRPQPHPMYYQYYMSDSQNYTVPGRQLY